MPIKVSYQPPLGMLSQAGYLAGAGQFAQRQQELALRQQEHAIAAQQRQQALELQNRGQLMDYAQVQQANYLRQQALAQDAAQQQQQFELGQARNQAYLKQLEYNNPAVRQDMLWQQNTAKELDKHVNTVRTQISKLPLTPEGKDVVGKLDGILRGIQAERHKMLPQQYSQAIGQWLQKVEDANVQGYIEPPMTAADYIQRYTMPYDENNEWVINPKTGQPTLQSVEKPASKAADKPKLRDEAGVKIPFETYANNVTEFEKAIAAKRREMLEEAKVRAVEGGKIEIPDNAKVIAAVRAQYEDMQAATDPKPQTPPPPPARQPPPPPPPAAQSTNGKSKRLDMRSGHGQYNANEPIEIYRFDPASGLQRVK